MKYNICIIVFMQGLDVYKACRDCKPFIFHLRKNTVIFYSKLFEITCYIFNQVLDSNYVKIP